MVLQEVTPALTLEQEFEVYEKQFQELKQHINDCIQFEDFETLTSYDIEQIKRLYFTKSILFWKIRLEPIEKELKQIRKSNRFNYEYDKKYCELSIKQLQIESEIKQAELKSIGDFTTFNNEIKPVLENQLINWQMKLKHLDTIHNGKKEHRKVEVIP